eukprot:g2629.t1
MMEFRVRLDVGLKTGDGGDPEAKIETGGGEEKHSERRSRKRDKEGAGLEESGGASVSRKKAKSKKKKSKRISSGALRLMSDLRTIEENCPEGFSAGPIDDDNIFSWEASVFGPEGTPWEGGVFSLSLVFPESYPSKPPFVRFTSEVFHPNVYADGTLCLDIIQDSWSPVHTVSSILQSIQSLLTDPNPDSPANVEAAKLLKSNRKIYNRRVRRCASKAE